MSTCLSASPNRVPLRRRAALVLLMTLAVLAGCASPPAVPGPNAARQGHVPAFARKPYAPFTRADTVAIALREWRLFGQVVDDDPPGTHPPLPAEQKPERMPGQWQRVGEYWWIGQDADRPEGAWTGKHDENGYEFPAASDENFAWSAAFVSYVMRVAGAGIRFPYSPSHHTYINLARQMSLGQTAGWAVAAERTDAYAPVVGDLVCAARGWARRLRFADLPTPKSFPAHCAIVVGTGDALSVIGGNVEDTVALTHVPTTVDGKLAIAGGIAVDARYAWFVVLRVLYDQ